MKVLADHFVGLTTYCPQCNCLLGYNAKDIYEKCFVYCPRCKCKIEVALKE